MTPETARYWVPALEGEGAILLGMRPATFEEWRNWQWSNRRQEIVTEDGTMRIVSWFYGVDCEHDCRMVDPNRLPCLYRTAAVALLAGHNAYADSNGRPIILFAYNQQQMEANHKRMSVLWLDQSRITRNEASK